MIKKSSLTYILVI